MRKKFLLSFLLVLSVILVLGGFTKPIAQAQGVGHEDVLIGFKKFPGKSEEAHVMNAGGKIKFTYHLVPVIAASVPAAAIPGLKHNPNIAYVEEDGDVFAVNLDNSWGVDRIDADEVWDGPPINKGAGVYVAILDTGIDMDHADLAVNVVDGINFVRSKGKVDPEAWDDDNGHGSHCAGIVAAEDDGFGVVGVAPDVSLFGVKVLDKRGRGKESDIIAGIEWAVDNNADIISMSIGGGSSSSSHDACDTAYAAGLILVASAGNTNGGDCLFPAAFESVIAVSATDKYDALASFSAVDSEIELAAPGASIFSTYMDGGYTSMSGTSMSCPHVAGVAALVLATHLPYVSPAAVRIQIGNTAEPIGLTPEEGGWGLVDAQAAVAVPWPALNVIEGSMDNVYYPRWTTQPAIVTIVVIDEYGSPVDGLSQEDFYTRIRSDLNPTPVERALFFSNPGGGIYVAEEDISDLPPDQYQFIVSASETGRTCYVNPFIIQEASGGTLSTEITTNKEIYTIGEWVYVTVTVKDGNGDTVANADVRCEFYPPGSYGYRDDKVSDANGEAHFKFKIKKPDGTGTYMITAGAYMDGYISGWSEKYITVQ
jgi:subtilisin